MNNRNYKYISVDVIASRITKHPLLKDINYEDIISHTVDVLRLSQVPSMYVEASCYIPIIEFKAKLPNDNLNLKAVDFVKGNNHISGVIATDTMHNHINKLSNKNRNNTAYTYTVNNSMIHTNQESGKLFIVYDKLHCSEDGFPMIPDSVPLIKAIESYIKVQYFTVLTDLGKMNGRSLDNAEQEYGWYIGKAQTEFQGFQNEDDTESFLRDFKRLFIENKTHNQRNMYNVNRELKYKH